MSTTNLAGAPMGATLVPGGATFRVWAPRATAVYVCGEFNNWRQDASSQLSPIGDGQWVGFTAGLKDGDPYLFYVNGPGSSGYKRDPRARELGCAPPFPQCDCVLREPSSFPWHETGFRPPAFNDLIVYQLHVGTYFIEPGSPDGSFLDVIGKVPYLAALGVTAIEPMPIQEFETQFSLGYNGTDYYSPEDQYGEYDETKLQGYFATANTILNQAGQPGYTGIDALRGADSQLKAL